MTILHIILWHLPLIGSALFLEDIHRISLLKDGIADVFLIGEDLFDVTLMSCNRNRLPLSSDGLCNTR